MSVHQAIEPEPRSAAALAQGASSSGATPDRIDWVLRGESAIAFLYSWIYYPVSQRLHGDFFAMMTNRDAPEVRAWDGRGYGYGPLFALYELCLRPFHDDAALRTMFVVNMALLAGAFVLLMKTFIPPPRTARDWSLAVFLWANFYPLVQVVRQDNVEATELFFLAACAWALTRRRDAMAGVSLGMAISTKIVPIVLVPWLLWRRRWLAAGVTIAVFVAMLVLVASVKGFDPLEGTRTWQMAAASNWAASFHNNQGLSGFFLRCFSHFNTASEHELLHPDVFAPRLAYGLSRFASLALVVTTAVVFIRRAGYWPRPEPVSAAPIEMNIILTVVLLGLPFAHTHYFALVVGAFFIALKAFREGRLSRRAAWSCLAAYAAAGLLTPLRIADPIVRRFVPASLIELAKLASVPMFGMLIALAILFVLHQRELGDRAGARVTVP